VEEQSVEEWARTAQFAQPVRWGEIETGILARDPFPPDERLSLGMAARVGAAWAGVGVFGILFYGSSLIGLAFVVAGNIGSDASWDWVTPAQVAFAVAVMVEVVSFLIWWEIRRRSVLALPVSALTVVASVAAYVVLARSAEESRLSWLPLLVLIAAMSGAAMFVIGLMSKPEGRDKSRKPPQRGPKSARKRGSYAATRARVLEILTERGVVDLDEADRKRVLEMPLGYWEELDGLDEKEWRRVLELRSVGWREFDASDRRPWPPAEVH
jgi:flagellar basal body-associated protein FliL